MADGQLRDVLRHVHKLLGAKALEELTDGQLLERFISRQEEAAFAVLVRRHGPMVLGVCRRVLHHWHAAEDAFQATFLVLFRRARSLDRRGSVANWLYTVAYHVALKARASAAHRRLREREVVEMPQAEPQPEEVWRDLQPVLDEELNSLPEKYRAAIVLCYVEGKTNAEAARLLRWPIGTVKGRLARARELLRTRLGRRGITLSTGLLGVVLAEHASAAVPGLLLESTIKTVGLLATGKATAALSAAPAAVLAEGVLKTMFATKLKIATALSLAIGVLGMGVGTVTQQVLAQRQDTVSATTSPRPGSKPKDRSKSDLLQAQAENKPSSAAQPQQPKTEDKNEMLVTGRVLDANGKPVEDAQVAVVARPKVPFPGWEFSAEAPQVLGQVKVEADGRFRLPAARTSSVRFWSVYVLAGGKGHGLGMQQLSPDAELPEAIIKLPPEQIIRGRLLDLQGQPVAGATVHVAGVRKAELGESAPVLFWNPPRRFSLWPEPVITNEQGQFILHGLNRDQGVELQIRDDRFALQFLSIPPQKQESELTLALAPAQIIEGQVLCADTHKPMPHARLVVRASEAEEVSLGVGTATDGMAGADGRFRLNPFAGKTFTVTAYAAAGMPYLTLMKGLKWPKGAVKQQVELKLPRGVLVTGTVTEAPSGKPVVGAGVQFIPRSANNPHLRDDVCTGWAGMVVSGADGVFQIPILPGPGHLLINGPASDFIHQEIGEAVIQIGQPGGRRYYPDGLVKLDLPAETATKRVAVTLRRGVTLRGHLVGADGKPVPQALMLCRLNVAPFELSWRFAVQVHDGQFELHGCDPEKTYPVHFLDPKNRLGATVMLSGRHVSEPVKVELAPCGTAVARFVDPEGKPLKNYRPSPHIVITPGADLFDESALKKGLLRADADFVANIDRLNYWDGPRTDDRGRCVFPALIPGATYRIHYQSDRTVRAKDFTVEAGKTLDLPDLTIEQSE